MECKWKEALVASQAEDFSVQAHAEHKAFHIIHGEDKVVITNSKGLKLLYKTVKR